MNLYILNGRTPMPVRSHHAWARWYESADRTLARARVGKLLIDATFLAKGEGQYPQLFELMVSRTDAVDFEWARYYSADEAEAAHASIVQTVRYVHDPVRAMQRVRQMIGVEAEQKAVRMYVRKQVAANSGIVAA